MILPTRFGAETDIPDAVIESVYGTTIYRLTADVKRYGLSEGTVLLANREQELWHVHDMGLDSALRACNHATSGYGWSGGARSEEGELAVLSRFVAGNWHLWHVLLDWKTMSPAERRVYETICGNLAEQLTGVRNPHKVLAHERTLRATSVIDSRGRTNPVSRQALHAWAAHEIELRDGDIMQIAMRIDMRKARLIEAIERNMDVLRRAYESLRLVAQATANIERPEQATGMREQLPKLAARLRKTHDLPWRHVSRRTAQDLVWAANRLKPGRNFNVGIAIGHVERGRKSIRQLRKYRELADFQLATSLALARRPRNPEEIQYLFGELVRYRASIKTTVDDEFRNPIMARVRSATDRAIAEWRATRYHVAKRMLHDAAKPF